MFVLQLPSGFLPLVTTSKSESLAALFLRYLSTINHVDEWSESDLLDPSSKAYKSIAHVRMLHKSIYEKMNRSRIAPLEDGIWVSQNAMTDTQWAFIGLLFLYPREICVSGSDEEVHATLSDIGYLWRCVGWMHGITDENNLCSGSVEETIALSRIIFQRRYEPVVGAKVHCNPMGYQMGLDIVTSMPSIVPGLNGEIILTFWSNVFGIEMPYLRPLSYWESFIYYCLCLEHKYAHGTWYRKWHTSRVRARLAWANKNKQQLYQSLCEQDPTIKYAPEAVAMSPCGFAFPTNFVDETQKMKQRKQNLNNNVTIRNEE